MLTPVATSPNAQEVFFGKNWPELIKDSKAYIEAIKNEK